MRTVRATALIAVSVAALAAGPTLASASVVHAPTEAPSIAATPAPSAEATPASAEPTPTAATSPTPTSEAAPEPSREATPTPAATRNAAEETEAPTPTPASTAAATTPPVDPDAPADARISASPSSAPRLANVLLEGTCTELSDDFPAQWLVEVTLSVGGEQINLPVFFATEYDGSFSMPIQLVGSAAASPAPGDEVVIDARCGEFIESGEDIPSFRISTTVTVNDAPTCPGTVPEATGELDNEAARATVDGFDGTGSLATDGWLPESEVLVCYFTNPEIYDDRPNDPQRFGAGTADAEGAATVSTIGPAVDPDWSGEHREDARFAATADDSENADESGDASGEEQGEQTEPGDPLPWIEKLAAIGTAPDGSPRALVADITTTATATSGDVPISVDGGEPELAATGANSLAAVRLGLGFAIVGAAVLLIARRRVEA